MKFFLPLKCIFFIFFIVNETNQSHKRGGTLSWAPVDNSVAFPIASTSVSIRQRYFVRFGADEESCQTPDDIRNGSHVVNDDGNDLESLNGPSWLMSTQVYCFAYNETEDWQGGDRTQTQDIITSEPVNALYTDGSWINDIILTPDLVDVGDLLFEVTIDLKKRSDTGKINSSPFVNLTKSVYKFSTNCTGINQYYTIPVSDPDVGDLVRCRCRNNSCHENFKMDEANCIYFFNPNTTGNYGVYLTIEDFAPSNTIAPLSSIPMLVLVQVTDRPEDCCN